MTLTNSPLTNPSPKPNPAPSIPVKTKNKRQKSTPSTPPDISPIATLRKTMYHANSSLDMDF